MDGGQNETMARGFECAFGCSEQPESSSQVDTAPLKVYSFSYPTSYLVDRLAGDVVDHSCILPAGEDAASWKPSTDLIIELQADALFSNGLGFEGWVKTAALQVQNLFEAAKSVEPIKMTGKTHSSEKVVHIRMVRLIRTLGPDPNAYIQMVETVATALYTESPDLTEKVQGNLATLKSELTSTLGMMNCLQRQVR